jgi:hypothetical protein
VPVALSTAPLKMASPLASGVADADVVPVGGVQDGLVRMGRARQAGDDIVGLDLVVFTSNIR